MNHSKYHPSNWSVGSKVSAITFGLMSTVIAGLVAMITMSTSNMLEERAKQDVTYQLQSVGKTVGLFDHTVTRQAVALAKIFRNSMPGVFERDTTATVDIGGKALPTLKLDGKVLNLDFTIPDKFTEQTATTATIFVLAGDDFVRVTTSVKNESGERAVGTVLASTSPAYGALREGRSYTGLITLFGKQYVALYDPIRDAGGQLIGASYVGLDITADVKVLKEQIRSIKVGETGYYYVLNANPGKTYGELIVHPAKEGANILESKGADGSFFIKEILEKKNGTITYDWQNPNETTARSKFVAYTHIPEWNWVIAGGTYRDEITAAATALRTRFILIGIAALAFLAGVVYLVMRRSVSIPLAKVRDAARRMADGDLSAHIDSTRRDEIGMVNDAINAIGVNLSNVVGTVRTGADQIAHATREISAGNLDLCQRTEQQAVGLAGTARSMDQLTATVRQNADNARQANTLAFTASTVAQKGGTTVGQVITRMESITQASRKISDITSVIDGIAFQTNILALNAAVEAARAGEQGRGFAVVANEVRNLAQRCAAAAKEIKALIDASNGEVDAGSRLVAEAGVTMNEVLESVGRVTDIMAEITSASAEQTTGIEQVNRSIGEMDESTQQNAALVEEASAAAQAMQDQAAELARAVRLFKVGEQPVLKAPKERLAIAGR